jgi:hypothetical protein
MQRVLEEVVRFRRHGSEGAVRRPARGWRRGLGTLLVLLLAATAAACDGSVTEAESLERRVDPAVARVLQLAAAEAVGLNRR